MRAYQGIFARFNLSSSASSASDFFFRPPRPRNPILLFNLSSCFGFWWCLLFLRRVLPLHFFFSCQKAEKAEKAREISMQKYLFSKRKHTTKKRKEKKSDTTALFTYSLFLYLSSSRKERVHTHNNTNARALERLKERDDY